MHPRLRAALDAAVAAAPGALACALVALAASALSSSVGGPQLLYALLLGMGLNLLATDTRYRPGIDFCGRVVLRVGVALLGARITAEQVISLGPWTAFTVVLAVLSTIGLGLWLARLLGRSTDEGLISGGSVGICGALAALAVASVLPDTRENQRYTVLAVAGVTLLSTAAMVLYPILGRALDLDAVATGTFLGGSIHDVAQVVASAAMVDEARGSGEVLATATIVKLFRVMLLVPIVVAVAILYRRAQPRLGAEGEVPDAAGEPTVPVLPGFLLAFILLVMLNSSGLISTPITEGAITASRVCLVLAIAAAGIKTRPAEMRQLGWLPVLMLGAETVWIALVVLTLQPLGR